MSTVSPPIPYAPSPSTVADDDDYDYFWTVGGIDVPIPRWWAEIIDVQPMVRVEIFLFGLCSGLFIAAAAVLLAFYFAVG